MNALLALGAVVLFSAFFVGVWLGVVAIFAAVLSWTWNLVVPTTFNGPVLDFGAAFALLVVFIIVRNFLFGGWGKTTVTKAD